MTYNLTANTRNYGQITLITKSHLDPLFVLRQKAQVSWVQVSLFYPIIQSEVKSVI